MRFLVDAQLPPALARLLAEHDHHAEHVIDIAPGDTPDAVLWQYALDHEAVIITKDEDFVDLVARSRVSPAIVWVRAGNTTRRALLEWFLPRLDTIIEMVEAGDTLIELR